MPINYSNVVAGTAFRVKIPQSGVCAFLIFYVQSKTNNDTYKSRFAINFSALSSYSLYGNNNTSLLNNI